MVPGAISLIVGLWFIAVCRQWRNIGAAPSRPSVGGAGASPRAPCCGLVLVIGIATTLTGLTFQTTTIALPKLFDDGLSGSPTARSASAGCLGGDRHRRLRQIGVGWLIDRYPAKPVWIAVRLPRAPLIAAAGVLAGHGLIIVALAMMMVVVGEIPIQDALVTHYTAESWRARIFGIKFLLGLGASAIAAPLVAGLHGVSGGFLWLFVGLGGSAALSGHASPSGCRAAEPAPPQPAVARRGGLRRPRLEARRRRDILLTRADRFCVSIPRTGRAHPERWRDRPFEAEANR